MRYRTIVGLAVVCVLGPCGCMAPMSDEPEPSVLVDAGAAQADAGERDVGPDPADAGESATEPETSTPMALAPAAPPALPKPVPGHDNAPVPSQLCAGKTDAEVLSLQVLYSVDHVIVTCSVDDGSGFVPFEIYRLNSWDSRALRCDVDGWIFATSDAIAYAVIPDTGGEQVRLDCAIQR